MTATFQRKLPMPVETLCVLCTVGGVRAEITWLDEDDVLAAVLDHTLSPAFDLGMGGRRDLRIAPSALEFFRRTNGAQRRRVSEREMFEEILRGAIAGGDARAASIGLSQRDSRYLVGERVRMILNCGSTHLINLIDDEELAQMPGTNYRRGPNGSAQITLVSFKDFLKRRLAK